MDRLEVKSSLVAILFKARLRGATDLPHSILPQYTTPNAGENACSTAADEWFAVRVE
jgi:hypothetical protein